MRILITGGAGFLGSHLAKRLIDENPSDTVVIYSRDEGKHQAMRAKIPEGGRCGARYMLGDICDYDRLCMAMKCADYVYHCAAMKCIDACEYDSMEAARTNVDGTRSVIRACIACGVKRAVHIGTDKAVDPVSVYGKTKALAEALWVQANTYGDCEFYGVRYGNVAGSSKSVFHSWSRLRKEGKKIPLTSATATRFYWHVDEAVDFVRNIMEPTVATARGSIFFPENMASYSMADIAGLYGTPEVVGWRCPEKEHEVLLTEEEKARACYSFGLDAVTVFPPTTVSFNERGGLAKALAHCLSQKKDRTYRSDSGVQTTFPDYLRPEYYE